VLFDQVGFQQQGLFFRFTCEEAEIGESGRIKAAVFSESWCLLK
jgi:hypothetical protein